MVILKLLNESSVVKSYHIDDLRIFRGGFFIKAQLDLSITLFYLLKNIPTEQNEIILIIGRIRIGSY